MGGFSYSGASASGILVRGMYAERRILPGRMISKVIRYLKYMRSMSRINLAMSRAAATSNLRQIDPTDPASWEFSGFSQNGEDGLLDFLTREILEPSRYFIEIGAGDGIENNTTWLAVARRYSGLMIDGDEEASDWRRYLFTSFNYGVEHLHMFVGKENVEALKARALCTDPDVLSLDIDENDYYVAEAMLKAGFRPKIFVVEYNSAFGPSAGLTIKYREDFRVVQENKNNLYYGCSVAGWRRLFSQFQYKFLTVDLNGVNAFFIDPGEFDAGFVNSLRGVNFRENYSQTRQYKMGWQEQFELIKDRKFFEIE